MNPEIKRMVKDSGGSIEQWMTTIPKPFAAHFTIEQLDAFIAIVAEECAKVVEPDAEHRRDASWGYLGGEEGVELLDAVAKTIRAKFALSGGEDK